MILVIYNTIICISVHYLNILFLNNDVYIYELLVAISDLIVLLTFYNAFINHNINNFINKKQMTI